MSSVKIFVKPRRASVLVFSLVILSIALVSALTIAATANVNLKESLSVVRTNQAIQVADSALELVLHEVYQVSHSDPDDLANSLPGGGCTSGVIEGTVNGGSFRVTFYDSATQLIPCTRSTWRDDLIRIRAEGTRGGVSRVIETAVAAP